MGFDILLNWLTQDIIVDLAQIITALGVAIAVWQIMAEHGKARREFAAKLIWDWTTNIKRNSKIVTAFIDGLEPTACLAIYQQKTFCVNVNQKEMLHAIISGASHSIHEINGNIHIDIALSSELRSIVTSYLNLLESVFVAWHHRVGDQKIIEQQFRPSINPSNDKIFLQTYLGVFNSSDVYPMINEYIGFLRKRKFAKIGSLRWRLA